MNVIGGLQFNTVYLPSMKAVARWPQGTGSSWKWGLDLAYQTQGLIDKAVLDGGLTRFKLDLTQGKHVYLEVIYKWWEVGNAWLSQSSWILDALNITEGKENLFIIKPPFLQISSTLHEYDGLTAFFNLCDGKPPIEGSPSPSLPIYLFLYPLPESISEFASWRHQPYFWSFDETGQSKMSEVEYERWEFLTITHKISGNFSTSKWPTYVYTALQDWQKACGYNPATSDWARSMEYPEFEIIGARKNQSWFEKVTNYQGKSSSLWWEAFAGSGISAFGF
ncbi:hypothetical protein Moror_2830 [Moniliophthora roreri MCA 2997]|uniref:Uncharacterized protein n=2 Tax=Moniliophthora roreri TaxID=221103 RepID=V2XFL6_MONRO|nr:hypothetical protein Moror_2830 [Moniliophthora roreri MCA 2997]